MNLQQLRYLHGIAEQGFNISRAAAALHTSQPGISKQIQMLEQEIGIAILVRKGNRIVGVTEPGRAILDVARRMLHDAENLKRIGEDFTSKDEGRLVVATTHMHARYVLRDVIRDFIRRHPNVQLILRQASPAQTAQLVASGEATRRRRPRSSRVVAHVRSLGEHGQRAQGVDGQLRALGRSRRHHAAGRRRGRRGRWPNATGWAKTRWLGSGGPET